MSEADFPNEGSHGLVFMISFLRLIGATHDFEPTPTPLHQSRFLASALLSARISRLEASSIFNLPSSCLRIWALLRLQTYQIEALHSSLATFAGHPHDQLALRSALSRNVWNDCGSSWTPEQMLIRRSSFLIEWSHCGGGTGSERHPAPSHSVRTKSIDANTIV